MTADYPATIHTSRTLENYPGETYDATKTKRLYAEDINDLADEVTAIETELGSNPKGTDVSVVARLDRMDTGGGGGLAASWFLS